MSRRVFAVSTPGVAISLLLTVLVILVISPPEVVNKCKKTQETAKWFRHSSFEMSQFCKSLLLGLPVAIAEADQQNWCPTASKSLIYDQNNCNSILTNYGFTSHKVTQQELDFPLAFSILMYDGYEQFVHLLSLIYRSHNFYCVHVDKKASDSTKASVVMLTKCLPNVELIDAPYSVHWAEYSVLQAEMSCIRYLWEMSDRWKYFINLTGKELPLRTNFQLVQILTAYNGANDIDGSPFGRNTAWTDYVWYNENYKSSIKKSPAPHHLVVNKGSAHIAASRAFIHYVLHNRTAIDLYEWMHDIRAPDEHYFATLNHNPAKGVPGAYTDIPTSKIFLTRYKLWQTSDEKEICNGRWVRFVCNFGAGDLHRVAFSTALFANKFNMYRDTVAYACMEQWYAAREYGMLEDSSFNLSFYEKQPWVKKHA